ncbi:hypothetical protein [Catellatospora vulcania]|uniref:hypothetical protein n=1 Tax=Catellatospora vulcania TaxID=1460450 RepID=UPI0012D3C10A|nr:hypothetical protein [Catellatospora vulcania]
MAAKRDMLDDLADVRYTPAEPDGELLDAAAYATESLVKLGVSFTGSERDKAPWLVAARPFALGDDLWERLERLGAAVFALVDAAQDLYREGDAAVRGHLDTGVPEDLRGFDLARYIEMFRLDVVVSGGRPLLTEVEEIFGNAGKAHAFERAYGVSAAPLFDTFRRLGFAHIWLDDGYPMYRSENELVAQRMGEDFGMDVDVEPFSRFRDDGRIGWRFCYVKEFRQYDARLRAEILGSAEQLVNPLFHGYGTKGLLSLSWDERLEDELAARMGAAQLSVLREGVPRSALMPKDPTPEFLADLKAHGRRKVLKVVDSDGVEFTWGSRGVYFGDQSASRWHAAVDAAAAGHIPGHPEHADTSFLISDLADSDRFDVQFLHPHSGQLCLMPRARLRLTPIFTRAGTGSSMLGGHATFVNTSRKVHLGRHAVCTPFTK